MRSDQFSTVNALYIAYFGRPADPAGLRHWSDMLANMGGNSAGVIASFDASDEAQNRFGQETASARIAAIYQQLFNRAPEPEGLAFWVGLVNSGQISLAEAAFKISNSAGGGDAELVALRKKAAADFTQALEDGGASYAGDEAVVAGRALSQAIHAGASDADIAKAVDAAVKLVDLVTQHPGLIDLFTGGSPLLDLFDTARGQADPVGLLQVLGALAGLAVDDPDSLGALLRGGDLAQMLNAMPRSVTLEQLFDAVLAGQMQSLLDLVYPAAVPYPAPPVPLTLSFESVTSGTDDRAPTDAVTKTQIVDVRFDVSGTLKPGESIQYSVDDGGSWRAVSAVNNTLTVTGVDLAGGTPGIGKIVTDVMLRVIDAGGGTVRSFSQEIVYDTTPPAGTLSFDRIGSGLQGDLTTNTSIVDVKFGVSGHDADDGHVQWRFKGEASWTDVSTLADDGSFTLEDIDLSTSDRTIQLRVVDAAGNVGMTGEWTIDGPAGPTVTSFEFLLSGNLSIIRLFTDTGSISVYSGQDAESGLITKTGLSLSDMKTGTAQATATNYTDGSDFGLLSGALLRFDQTLDVGIYRLAWTDSNFHTARGNVQAGELLFAGGITNRVGGEGFKVASIVTLTADVDSPDTANLNNAYLHDTADAREVFTGGGRDVILDNGGELNIGYRAISAIGSDIVFGFDAGSDIISFHGAAATALDRSGDEALEWATSASASVKAIVTSTTEAVSFVKYDSEWVLDSNTAHDQGLTAAALNGGIDLTGFAAGGQLLILAKDTSGSVGMLMHFTDGNGNRQFDAGEVKAIATFDGGVPLMGDILLV